MSHDDRYDPIEALFTGITVPALSRHEAERAARELLRLFTKREDCSPTSPERLSADTFRVRRCWLATNPGYQLHKGWGRLIHDVSHRAFRFRHPGWRPHEHGHERLELAVARAVLDAGYFDGRLKPPPPPTRTQAAAQELASLDVRVKRWTAKAKRASTALAKLARRRRVLETRVAQLT